MLIQERKEVREKDWIERMLGCYQTTYTPK
jgi:hypothetical protein